MEFWIERGRLMTWMEDSRKIQEKIIAEGVVDADFNHDTGEWLVVRNNGTVESLSAHLQIPNRTFSNRGLRARWSGDSVQVSESTGSTVIYDSCGFIERTF